MGYENSGTPAGRARTVVDESVRLDCGQAGGGTVKIEVPLDGDRLPGPLTVNLSLELTFSEARAS